MIGDAFGGAHVARACAHRYRSRGLIFYSIVTVHTWRFQRAAKARVEEMVTMERPAAVRGARAGRVEAAADR